MKNCSLNYVGLGLCLAGEVLRKLAMFTAKSNFNHIIQVKREEGHVLVTNGIYGLCRHPSYVGWFWWSIGTQVSGFAFSFFLRRAHFYLYFHCSFYIP